MNTGEHSLRQLIEKWFAPNPAMPAHVTQFGRMRESKQRFVRVGSTQQSYPFAIFFFRHWRRLVARLPFPAPAARNLISPDGRFDPSIRCAFRAARSLTCDT